MHTYRANNSGSFDIGYPNPTGGFTVVTTAETESAAQALASYLNGGTAPA
jgi:hypothetical protein